MTTGTLEAKDGKFITHEDVKGDANGVTEVRSTSEILRVFEERRVDSGP